MHSEPVAVVRGGEPYTRQICSRKTEPDRVATGSCTSCFIARPVEGSFTALEVLDVRCLYELLVWRLSPFTSLSTMAVHLLMVSKMTFTRKNSSPIKIYPM